jgi:hypothetical protein
LFVIILTIVLVGAFTFIVRQPARQLLEEIWLEMTRNKSLDSVDFSDAIVR